MVPLAIKEKHNNKAVHNQSFYNSIKTDLYPDWAIIILFYKSVHLIESVLATINEHPDSHQDRSDLMIKHSDLISKEVRTNYNQLKSFSHLARYNPNIEITDENLDLAQQCIDVIVAWHKQYS